MEKESLGSKDLIQASTLFASLAAISYEVGAFSATGGFQFFSLTDHLLSAMSALPIALTAAIGAVVVYSSIWRWRKIGGGSELLNHKRQWLTAVLALIFVLTALSGIWLGSAVIGLAGICGVIVIIVFLEIGARSTEVIGLVTFAILACGLPLSVGFDVARSLERNAKPENLATVELKSGRINGHIIMVGERGVLLYRPDTKSYLFQKSDAIVSIEYRLRRLFTD
jgi:hypothetical protein